MRCPACKAVNAEGQVCRRCKADLALLFDLERRREWCLAEARRCLRDGNNAEAMNLALRAEGLRGDTESRRLVAIASLLSGNFEQALRYHAGTMPDARVESTR